jgi:hypothetical protein
MSSRNFKDATVRDMGGEQGGNSEREAQPEPERVPDDGQPRQREVGGRKGPEPTRFGDWERNGRCIDF